MTVTRTRLNALSVAFAVIAAVTLVAIVAGVAYLTAQNNRRGEEIKKTLVAVQAQAEVNGILSERIKAIQSAIKACTIPQGDCYQAEEVQDAAQVGDINAITYLAVWCADQPGSQTFREVVACVQNEI